MTGMKIDDSDIVDETRRYSVAMTGKIEQKLRSHLLRQDGQEDLCLAIYQPSKGATRTTALLTNIILPELDETTVHGNVSFTGEYVLRAIEIAYNQGGGIAILHSHPMGSKWQGMSGYDKEAEAAYANIVREITSLPLIGLTLAGQDGTWSARFWNKGKGSDVSEQCCENVRVISNKLSISWNPSLNQIPSFNAAVIRPISCWGTQTQADIARLRILVIGAGTVGLDVAIRLAATGIQNIDIMDFDSLKIINLGRMIGTTPLDVWLCRSKVEIAIRLIRQNTIVKNFRSKSFEGSICETEQVAQALDYDLIFCCVDDHPWPRSVLNTIAYTDLIPVIDGGIHIDAFPDGKGMRNATWRSHVLRPGRPCMACNGQLDLGKVMVDKEGLLDDKSYIAGLPLADRPQTQNVAALSVNATASLLAQFISFVAAPADIGDPGPLRYSLSTHWLEHVEASTREHCPIEQNILAGDNRQLVLGVHESARNEIRQRNNAILKPLIKFGRMIDDVLTNIRYLLINVVSRRVNQQC